MLGSVLAAVVSVIILAASRPIARNFFDDDWVLVVALLIAFVSYTPAHIARGIASGHGRFRAYAVVMSAGGVVR
ncbi:MAG: hypothetical protein ACO3C1_10010, partial [Ilumatobacteraceae bacterium]